MGIPGLSAFDGMKASELLGLHTPGNTFIQDVKTYATALARTPQNFISRAVRVHKLADTKLALHSDRKGEMVKTLNWYALLCYEVILCSSGRLHIMLRCSHH